jgi:hypothetical protein
MAEQLRIYATSHAGFGHEYEIVGDRLVPTVNGTTAVVRVHNAAGRLARVVTYTQVDWLDFTPDADAPKENS